MAADIELLPLPCVLLNWPHPTNHVAIRDYARANVAHATAAKDAEIEALRAEVELWRHKAAIHKYRRERLAEALRQIRKTGYTDIGDRMMVDDALRDHEQVGAK